MSRQQDESIASLSEDEGVAPEEFKGSVVVFSPRAMGLLATDHVALFTNGPGYRQRFD